MRIYKVESYLLSHPVWSKNSHLVAAVRNRGDIRKQRQAWNALFEISLQTVGKRSMLLRDFGHELVRIGLSMWTYNNIFLDKPADLLQVINDTIIVLKCHFDGARTLFETFRLNAFLMMTTALASEMLRPVRASLEFK